MAQKIIDKRQVAAARTLLGWNQHDLAERAEIGVATVKNCERNPEAITPVIMKSIRGTFEEAGIEFINTDGIIGLKLKTSDKQSK